MSEKEPSGPLQTPEGPPPTDLLPPRQLETYFLEPDITDVSLQAVHMHIFAGLVARDCRYAYAINEPTRSRYDGRNALDHYTDIVDILLATSAEKAGGPPGDYERSVRWGRFHEILQTSNAMGDGTFVNYLASIRRKHLEFIEKGRDEMDYKDVSALVKFNHYMRTTSEIIVCEALEAYDADKFMANAEEIDIELMKDFTDRNYWEGNRGFSALPERERYSGNDRMMTVINMKELHHRLMSY